MISAFLCSSFVVFTDVKTNGLMSTLLESLSSEVGTRVEFVCPEGQTFTVEVLSSADDGYQLILHSSDLHILIAVRLSLINRLRVSPSID